jgi:crossover junction endodeoxyribonuclease RuvC
MPARPPRILGLDPGFGRTGFGIIEQSGREWKMVAAGIIETPTKEKFVKRLHTLHIELEKILKKYRPAGAVVEELFFAKNVTTGIKVAEARGVIILTLAQAKIPIRELTPLQVKQTLTGYGRAEKQQVEFMVSHILGLNKAKKKLKDDAYDALALALSGTSLH